MTNRPKILVTSAAGRTGSVAVLELLEKGFPAFMVKMMLTRAPDLDRWERERGHPMLREPVPAHDSPDLARSGRTEEAFPSADFP